MADLLTTLSNAVTLIFVVTSMLLVGFGLSLQEIVQPLRDPRVVTVALLVNFVVVPLTALGIVRVIPLDTDHEIGVVALGVAAGAPFLPKLAQFARSDVPFAVALMALLIVASVVCLPLALPLLLPGVRVDGAGIAMSLLLTILLPLGLGLALNRRWSAGVNTLTPVLTVVSNASLALLLVVLIGLNVSNVLAMFGSGAILAITIFTALATAIGYVLGGPRRDGRRVLGLGTGQRNVAACFIIANANFADRPQVLVLLAAASVISVLLVMPVVALFARQSGMSAGDA
jgi:BASS family bile acid:Na+ symporter